MVDKMETINKKIGLNFLVIGIFAVMLISLVSAIGFSSNDKTSPLQVYPGEIRNININIFPSSAEEGNRIARASMEDDAGIATITDSSLDYNLIVGQNTPVNMRINIPSSVAVGTGYVVKIRTTDITGTGGGGTVGLTTGSLISVYLKVVEKPAAPVTETPAEEKISTGWWILGVIVIIALIVIIYFIIKSRKK